jgi:hypothetical protein
MIIYSRFLHVLVLCTFFLPFFYTGCGGPSAEEKAKQEAQNQADSIAEATREMDSLVSLDSDTVETKIPLVNTNNIDTPAIENSFNENDADKSNNKEEYLSATLTKRYPFLKIFLNPEPNVYTGIGMGINALPYVFQFGTFLSLLFLIISLAGKFLEKSLVRINLFLEIIAAFFLYNAFILFDFSGEKLWGYWVALTSILLLILFDFYIWWQQRNNKFN